MFVVVGLDAAVADGDAVGVAREIGQKTCFGPAKGRLA